MSRFKLFASGVFSSYGLLLANIIYSFAGVPLALHYLTKSEFGLWALIIQIVGLLQLLELGVSSAFSRVIIDHKDDKSSGSFSSTCTAAWIILTIQGTLILLAGLGIGTYLRSAASIDPSLREDAAVLLSWQCLIVGIGFGLRIFSLILFAHHRIAFSNIAQSCAILTALAVQWLFFHLDFKLYSIPISAAASVLIVSVANFWACWRARLLPAHWRMPARSEFMAVLKFGHSIFLIHIGGQLVWATQTIILTRTVGLEAAAIWAVCTRPFIMISQLAWRPIDLSYTLLSEMVARKEQAQLWGRFKDVAIVTLVAAAVGGVGFAVCNQAFVTWWTAGRVAWPASCDLLLACWLIPLTLARCGNFLVQATKDIKALKWIFLIEGSVFVLGGTWAASAFGEWGLIGVALACTLAFTAPYGLWRVARYFEEPWTHVLATLLRPVLWIFLGAGAVGFGTRTLLGGLPSILQFPVLGLSVVLASLGVLRFALSEETKDALSRRMPGFAHPFIGFILGPISHRAL